MEKVAVLYFTGPNGISQVSMIFSSIEEGLKKVKEITGKDMLPYEKESKYDLLKSKEGIYHLDLYKELNSDRGCDDCLLDPKDLCKNCPHISKKFFTGYYGGCGAAGDAFLEEMSFAIPLFEWDLD